MEKQEVIRMGPPKWMEFGCASILVLCVFLSIPLSKGAWGLSWDSFNHHFYLGWVASENRFEKDLLAAGTQAYQFPYLYWPVFMMAKIGLSGVVAGVIWAALHALIAHPLWVIADALLPGRSWELSIYRISGVMMGVGSIVVLHAPVTTGNDVLASLPFLWGVAIGLRLLGGGALQLDQPVCVLPVVFMGVMGGFSVALKLSNGFLVVVLPILCLFCAGAWLTRVAMFFICGIAIVVSFVLVYGSWGWSLWQYFGNPFFPFYDHMFESIRAYVGWQPVRVP